MRSCGGPHAAAWLTAVPVGPQLTLCDADYCTVLRFRLGQRLVPASRATCALRYVRGNRVCGQPLHGAGHHAHVCAVGGYRIRRHHDLRDVLRDLFQDMGYHAEREVRVPEWDRQRPDGTWEEAVLDLRIESPWDPLRMIDVTVHHPVSIEDPARTRAFATSSGLAAADAEREKHLRYGASPVPFGLWAIAFETYGRMGAEGLNVLRSRAKAYVAADPFLSSGLATAGQEKARPASNEVERRHPEVPDGAVWRRCWGQQLGAGGAGQGAVGSAGSRLRQQELDVISCARTGGPWLPRSSSSTEGRCPAEQAEPDSTFLPSFLPSFLPAAPPHTKKTERLTKN